VARIRRGRGAVAIEALIVSTLLITVLGGGLFLHRAYQTKFRVIREARTAAWEPALRGCAKPPQPSDMSSTAASFGNEYGDGVDVSEQTFETWLTAGEHAQPRAQQVEGRNGFGSYTMTSKNSVTCNPVSSDEEGIEAIADVIIGTVNRE